MTDLYRQFDKPDMEMNECIHICMQCFIKIADLYENTHEYFQNYLDNIGTVNSCNEMARSNYKPTCHDEIVKANITTPYVINYMYFSLVNNRKNRDSLNINDIFNELKEEKANLTADNLEKSLGKLNTKIKEVSNVVSQMRNMNMDFDITNSMNTLDSIKFKLNELSQNQKHNINQVEHKLNTLNNTISDTGTKVSLLTENTDEVIRRFSLIMDEVGSKLARENSVADNLLAKQKMHVNTTMEEANKTLEINSKLENTLRELDNLFVANPSVDGISDSVNKILEMVNDFKQGTRNQVVTTEEIDDKIRAIEEGVVVIKQVLDTLNSIMREDILINLARTQKGVGQTAQGVEAIGDKYKNIRTGGIFSEHNNQ